MDRRKIQTGFKSKIKYEICEENAYGELAPAYKIIDVRNKLNK